MLRTLFVLCLAAIGAAYAVRGPFFALLLYLWVAYFRPESWVWGGIATTLPLSLVAGAFLLGSSVISGTRFRTNIRSGLLFALLLHSLVSTSLSAHFTYAWPYWTDFAKSTIVTYLIACLVTDTKKFRLTLLVISASLGFEVAKQGWIQLVTNPGEKNFNFHPFLGDENGVAVGSSCSSQSSARWRRPPRPSGKSEATCSLRLARPTGRSARTRAVGF